MDKNQRDRIIHETLEAYFDMRNNPRRGDPILDEDWFRHEMSVRGMAEPDVENALAGIRTALRYQL